MYSQLYEEYTEARRELEKGNWLPEPKLVFPRDTVVYTALESAIRQRDQLIQDTQYLEEHERTDAIPIAQIRGKKVTRLLECLEKLEQELARDITISILDYQVRYKAELQKLSNETMPQYRANRKKYAPVAERVEKAARALHDYYVELCTQTSLLRGEKCKVYFNLDDIPRLSGLYFIIVNGEVVYIGRSESIKKRLKNHDIVRKYSGQGEMVYGIIEMSPHKAKSLELDVIEIVRPAENKNGKRE